MDYGLIVKKDGVSKNVEDCLPKELAFHSSYPCAKILQPGKYSFTLGNGVTTTYNFPFDSVVALPIIVLVFLYDPSDSSYKAVGTDELLISGYGAHFWFSSTSLSVRVANLSGASISSHLIYFICYA